MAALPLKHSVLVTELLSDVAMQRLSTFFDVETRLGGTVPSHDELVDWLHGKAGVIADSRFIFDAPLISQLPTLKAVCNLDAAHHNLDLQALTQAGVRATHTPEPDLAWRAAEASAQRAWQAVQPLLARAAPVAQEAGSYGTWSRKLMLGASLQLARLGIFGAQHFTQALTARAQAAQVKVCTDRDSALSAADVLVIEDSPAYRLSEADTARMKSTACVFYLAADAGDLADAADEPWSLIRSNLAAENMVASLGFGRNSWHPQYLLNPDIACQSCC